jgi:hypothetical protein
VCTVDADRGESHNANHAKNLLTEGETILKTYGWNEGSQANTENRRRMD